MKNKIISYLLIFIAIVLFTLPPFKISAAYGGDIFKGDVNADGQVNLTDVVLMLQVLSQITPSANIYTDASVNNDNKIGIKEAIYVLQIVSGIRTMPPISSASVTDINGQIIVNIYGKTEAFELKDETTALPIEGLSVGFAANTDGLGVLVVIDPIGNYPAQIILLQGEQPSITTTSIPQAVEIKRTPLGNPLFPLLLSKEPSTKISRYILSTLPKHVNKFGDVLDIINLGEVGCQVLETAGLTHLGQPTGEVLTHEEAMSELRDEIRDSIKGQLFMFIATAGTPPGAAGVMIDLLTIGVKANTVINCGLPGQQISVSKIGWMRFYNCEQKTLSSMTDGLVRAAIQGQDQYGNPLDPSKSSLELISRDRLGDAYSVPFDNTGNLALTIPEGDYRTNLKSPGFTSQTFDTSLSQEGVTLNMTMEPVPSCIFSYSDWTACQPDNTQTRTVVTSTPAVCVGTPMLSQPCTYQDNICCACSFDVYCTVFGQGGCWICHNSTYSEGICQAPYGYLTSPGACICDPELYQVCQ